MENTKIILSIPLVALEHLKLLGLSSIMWKNRWIRQLLAIPTVLQVSISQFIIVELKGCMSCVLLQMHWEHSHSHISDFPYHRFSGVLYEFPWETFHTKREVALWFSQECPHACCLNAYFECLKCKKFTSEHYISNG